MILHDRVNTKIEYIEECFKYYTRSNFKMSAYNKLEKHINVLLTCLL